MSDVTTGVPTGDSAPERSPVPAPASAPPAVEYEFDRDTAVRRTGPGDYRAELSGGWGIGHALNGGYLLAVLGRALGEELPHPDPFTVSAHYLSATSAGPATVRVDTLRAGRTLSTATAGLYQTGPDGEETERIRVLATYGDLAALPDDVRTSAKPPAMPPPEGCFSAADAPKGTDGGSEMVHRLDLRMDPSTCGWAVGTPSGRGEMRAWLGLADGRAADPLSLLMTVDALPPTAFELGLTGWVPTVELTVHVRGRPAPGALRVAISTRNLAGGFLEEDAEIWDSEDRLVAQSRQLARARIG
ncbi:thioesterase family protein [Streptomyces sp. AJS327]|uniref:thioesterase family protein n=1 Tax=Streptomyces sp. AJS327 TaxID=2545265 RepID=UPI0015DDF493|nr:thioesterase family protein [Streptomyces sp. AJS327]MBA0051715.1 thioesterase family protein [Streptomyces sp. AJS327]